MLPLILMISSFACQKKVLLIQHQRLSSMMMMKKKEHSNWRRMRKKTLLQFRFCLCMKQKLWFQIEFKLRHLAALFIEPYHKIILYDAVWVHIYVSCKEFVSTLSIFIMQSLCQLFWHKHFYIVFTVCSLFLKFPIVKHFYIFLFILLKLW